MRDRETCKRLWRNFTEQQQSSRIRIEEILSIELDWQVSRFVPDDQCAVLLYSPGLGIAGGSAVLQIENEFEVNLSEITLESTLTLGELVSKVSQYGGTCDDS